MLCSLQWITKPWKEINFSRIANGMHTRARVNYQHLSCTLHPCVEIYFYAFLWRIDGRIVRSKAVRSSYRSHDECERQRMKWDVQRITFKIFMVIIYSMSSRTKNGEGDSPDEIALECTLFWRLFIFNGISFRSASNHVMNPPHIVKCAICNFALKEFFPCTGVREGGDISHSFAYHSISRYDFRSVFDWKQKNYFNFISVGEPSSINSTGLDWWIGTG